MVGSSGLHLINPPGITAIHTGAQRGFNDDRGVLFLEITRILYAKQPAGFILENVANLLDLEEGEIMTTILTELR